MSDISVGIIGYGRIGAEHAGWLSKARGVRVVAADDVTPARRRQLAGERGLRVYDNLAELLADKSIDAVLVSTPTAMHFEHASAALDAGKHVMIEKPMALDLHQSKALLDKARKLKEVLSVFHNRRWDADFLTVHKHVAAGTFGRIINVESRLCQWASCVGPAAREFRPNWATKPPSVVGGCTIGEAILSTRSGGSFGPPGPDGSSLSCAEMSGPTNAMILRGVNIDFDNGAVGMVEINTTTTSPGPRWHIDGTLGSAQSPASLSFDVEHWAKLEYSPAPGTATARLLDRAERGLGEVEIWERFAAAVRGRAAPAVDARSVLTTMMLLDAARQSSRTGNVVEIDHDVEWEF